MNHETMQECTAKLTNGVNRALCTLLDEVNEPVEKCSAIMTIGFSLNTVLAMHLGGPTRFNDNTRKLPGSDDQLLSSLVIAQSGTMEATGEAKDFDGHPGAYAKATIEFSPLNILTALDQFKKLTGRDGHDLLAPTLWSEIQRVTKIDPDGYGPLGSKFFSKN